MVDHDKLDRIGQKASLICAIHCAIMPIILVLMPFLATSFIVTTQLEWLLFGVSALLALFSVCWGARKHKSKMIFALLSVALLLIVAGLVSHGGHGEIVHQHFGWQSVLMTAGGLLLAAVHFINRRLCNSCHVCEVRSS